MKLKMRLCKKHGGTFRGLMYQRRTDNGVRCPVCEFEQRRMERNIRLAIQASARQKGCI